MREGLANRPMQTRRARCCIRRSHGLGGVTEPLRSCEWCRCGSLGAGSRVRGGRGGWPTVSLTVSPWFGLPTCDLSATRLTAPISSPQKARTRTLIRANRASVPSQNNVEKSARLISGSESEPSPSGSHDVVRSGGAHSRFRDHAECGACARHIIRPPSECLRETTLRAAVVLARRSRRESAAPRRVACRRDPRAPSRGTASPDSKDRRHRNPW